MSIGILEKDDETKSELSKDAFSHFSDV